MPETVTWALTVLGIACAMVLISFILLQWKRIKIGKQQEARKKEQDLHKISDIKGSLRILALSLIEEQIDLAEGCIRIKVLLDAIAPSANQNPDFSVFNLIYEETSHMPTHEARLEMDKHFRRKLDKQRFELESTYRTSIKTAAKKLFEQLDSL